MPRRLECCYVFAMRDDAGAEGCPKIMGPDGHFYWLMGTCSEEEFHGQVGDLKRLIADEIARQAGKPYRILKFSDVTDVTHQFKEQTDA